MKRKRRKPRYNPWNDPTFLEMIAWGFAEIEREAIAIKREMDAWWKHEGKKSFQAWRKRQSA